MPRLHQERVRLPIDLLSDPVSASLSKRRSSLAGHAHQCDASDASHPRKSHPLWVVSISAILQPLSLSRRPGRQRHSPQDCMSRRKEPAQAGTGNASDCCCTMAEAEPSQWGSERGRRACTLRQFGFEPVESLSLAWRTATESIGSDTSVGLFVQPSTYMVMSSLADTKTEIWICPPELICP